MIYLGMTESSFEVGIPYVMVLHDLLHRSHPEFPESFVHGSPVYYEYLYRHGTSNAVLILVDAEVTKQEVLKFYGPYGITADRIRVLPFFPSPYLPSQVSEEEIERTRTKYGLPRRYLFYPARCWAHKNHARLFEALALLQARDHLEISLVLVGFDAGDPPPRGEIPLRTMRSLSRSCDLRNQVRYLGVVPDEDMAGLYAGATALTIPVLLNATNVPVLEAWQLGCPVITSDLPCIREHVGDAALLVDPTSVESIADGIRRLWVDNPLRRVLAQRGHGRLESCDRQHFSQRLSGIPEDAKSRVAQ